MAVSQGDMRQPFRVGWTRNGLPPAKKGLVINIYFQVMKLILGYQNRVFMQTLLAFCLPGICPVRKPLYSCFFLQKEGFLTLDPQPPTNIVQSEHRLTNSANVFVDTLYIMYDISYTAAPTFI